MTDPKIQQAREAICHVGAMMFERMLTDISGGNVSTRVGDVICMTPRFAGSRQHWHIKPEDVLLLDLQGNIIEGEGQISRETVVHSRLLRDYYPDGQAVIHAHPRNILVFCATRQPIPMVLESTLKFGQVECVEYVPGGANSPLAAEVISCALRDQLARVRKQAAAVIAPWHGIFVLGKDLLAAIDALERIEVNARTILMSQLLLFSSYRLDAEREALMAAVQAGKGGRE